ncbi:uncharacterized protein LOC134450185 [Engraulis encrasicolus]|uniref:uncharacterized protein LOC134450185 n=1 Tax=Engraulis encrasicolus TaxID=184585 RepID=UPI002FCEFDCB
MKSAMEEQIEMKLFSSYGSSLNLWTTEKNTELIQKQSKTLEAPLKAPKIEKAVVEQKEKEVPATANIEDEIVNVSLPTQAIEIEMEVLPSLKHDVNDVESGDPSVLSPDSEKTPLTPRLRKGSKPKWRKMEAKPIGLVVKDVICLPSDTYLKQDDLYYVPSRGDRDVLALAGLVARITINSSWLSEEMEGRLSSLFKQRFYRSHAEKFQFTYLQCLQGSRVLFEPNFPECAWTAKDVLRICEKSPLFILSHHNLVDKRAAFSDPLKAY